jgi:hypothetical protein
MENLSKEWVSEWPWCESHVACELKAESVLETASECLASCLLPQDNNNGDLVMKGFGVSKPQFPNL